MREAIVCGNVILLINTNVCVCNSNILVVIQY